MTPFPETEIMTIKRIEVALRKLDFKLLKDGAYKLHEKFHSGYRFEFVDILKDLFTTISKNENIPSEIKGLLLPTIEDILNKQQETLPSIQTQNQTPLKDTVESQRQTIEPFKTFDPIAIPSSYETQQINQAEILNIEEEKPLVENVIEQNVIAQNNIKFEKPATISVFYGAQNSKEQEERIYQYKKIISENAKVNELADLTYKIVSCENIDITDLSLILNVLKQKNNEVNLLTNSKSEKMVKVLEDSGLDWSLFDFTKEKKKVKFYPVLGLNGLFKCKKCKREHFEIWDETMPLSLLCPNCKSPMFIDFAYSNDLDLSINMEYYNSSICALTESKIWLLVNPPVFDKIIIDMLKSALKISKIVEEIYIVSPSVEILDKYKSVFYSTGKNVKIDTTGTSLNNFWQAI